MVFSPRATDRTHDVSEGTAVTIFKLRRVPGGQRRNVIGNELRELFNDVLSRRFVLQELGDSYKVREGKGQSDATYSSLASFMDGA